MAEGGGGVFMVEGGGSIRRRLYKVTRESSFVDVGSFSPGLYPLEKERRDAAAEERSFLQHFFLGEAEEVSADDLAAEKTRRREQQKEAYQKVLLEKNEKREELRKEFMAQAARLSHNPDYAYPNGYMMSHGLSYALKKNWRKAVVASKQEDEGASEEECVDLEPLFFDEAEAVAEHAAAEEKRKQKEQKEQEEAREQQMLLRRWKFHTSVLNSILDYNHKRKRFYFRRFNFADLSTFDLDEESLLGPMRYTGYPLLLDGTVCIQGEERFLLNDSINVLSVKIASSEVGFPINVYGTVIARDSLDKKCVYLFRRDRNHCQLINSEDDLLILTGPKRGLALTSVIYFEMDLKIKSGQGKNDRQLSNGFLTLDAVARTSWDKMKVETDSLDTKLGVLEVTYAIVKRAVEATIAIEVVEGEFYGKITACTTNIRNCMVLHDSNVADVITCDGKRVVQMLRPTVAVFVKEKLEVTGVAQTGVGEVESTINFTPRASGVDEDEITCGSVKMLVKVSWSIIAR
ncbi:hypothetical protein EJB05_34343, partial [Eragrostis curvula]